MNDIYTSIKSFTDGMLGQDFAATSKYIAGGLAVACCIGLIVLIVRFVKGLMRI